MSNEEKTRTCLSCGAQLTKETRFCNQCGSPTEPTQEQTQKRIGTPRKLGRLPLGLRLLAAVLILLGAFLPFYNQGTTSLGSLLVNFVSEISLNQSYPAPLVFLVFTALLIVIGGIASLTGGLGGSLVTLTGILFAILSLNFIFGELEWITIVGIGFYAVVLGLLLSLTSNILGLRR